MKCVENMKALAERGHEGQVRKDGKTPYAEHPRAVAALLARWGVDDAATLAIAWGHDLLEDTDVTEAEIRRAAGPRHAAAVLAGIKALTRDRAAWPDKKEWLKHVARTAPPAALLVKAADRISNTRDFLALGDPGKARDYLAQGAPVFALAPEGETIAKELEALRAEIDAAAAAKTPPHPAPQTGVTELYFVLDRSGSMSGLVRSTIDGFNEMLEKQKRNAAGELFVSTVLFDDDDAVLHDHVPVAQMRPLTENEYRIGGCTALLDALGGAIEHAVRRQRHVPADRRAQNVVFVVITDGLENASRRYTAERVRRLVRTETDRYGWEFLYLGANIDSFEEAGRIGIRRSRTSSWVADARGARTNFAALSRAVDSVRTKDRACREAEFDTGSWKAEIDEDYRRRGKEMKARPAAAASSASPAATLITERRNGKE